MSLVDLLPSMYFVFIYMYLIIAASVFVLTCSVLTTAVLNAVAYIVISSFSRMVPQFFLLLRTKIKLLRPYLERVRLWAWQWKMQFHCDETEEVIFSVKRSKTKRLIKMLEILRQ